MASSSPTLHPQIPNPIPTIPEMIESLKNLNERLGTVLQKPTAEAIPPAQAAAAAAGDEVSGGEIVETLEPSAPAEAPEEEEHGKKETEQATEINGSNETVQEPQVVKLKSNIEHLMKALETTKDLDEKLNVPIQRIRTCLDEVIEKIKEAPAGSSLANVIGEDYLNAISMDMKTLKFQIPSYRKLSLAKTTAHLVNRSSRTPSQSEFKLPNLYGNEVFDESSAFKEIEKIFNGFSCDIHKKCFLCFAVFPENVELKKRFLTHWWIGEDLLDKSGTGDPTPEPEDEARRILKDFAEKGLIVPVKEEQKVVKKKFRMPPIVRSAAIKLAIADKFLVYDSGNNPTGYSSGCDKIFLVKGGGLQPPKALTAVTAREIGVSSNGSGDTPTGKSSLEATMATTAKDQRLEETMKTIFNVSQPFPDSALEWLAKKGEVDMRTVKVVEWLLKLRNLKVLYLGRWQSAADEPVIEVESLEFLKGLKKMKKLRLLSLQGIFWINKLPNSIKTLCELRVLDLKCCYNLEKLPESIGSLKRLTHLDVSGCYMLHRMPKSISRLTELRVLKGFVTGKSSLNDDLKGLKKLRKLSISTNIHDFPNETDLRVLQSLGKLRNLTIKWGAVGVKSKQPPSSTTEGSIQQQQQQQQKETVSKRSTPPNGETSELPKELEKLELECPREEKLPTWLNPSKLTSLKKLYIRGGRLKELGSKPWSAKVVRLKYMTELKIEWRDLQNFFPNLSYLQKVQCPRVTFCPCDANGVWMNQQLKRRSAA